MASEATLGVHAALEGLTLSPDRPGEFASEGSALARGSLSEFRILASDSASSVEASAGSSRRSSQRGDDNFDLSEDEDEALTNMARASVRLREQRQQRLQQEEAEGAARELLQTPPAVAAAGAAETAMTPSSSQSDTFAGFRTFSTTRPPTSPGALTPSSGSTATPVSLSGTSRVGLGLPPRSGGHHAPSTGGSNVSDSSAVSASVGKYVPPIPKYGVVSSTVPRYTPPDSPARAGLRSGASSPFMLSPQRPPSGPSAARFSPAAGSPHSSRVGFSPSKPPTTPTGNRLQNIPRTPPSTQRGVLTPYNPNVPHSAVSKASQKSAISTYDAKSCPTTPGSAHMLVDPDVASNLTKTALKRVVHDAKCPGLTFNQKKHRSPSHIRRSQRRQQERLASPGSHSKLSPYTNADGSERRDSGAFVDPWEDSENIQPAAASSSTGGRGSARQQLTFDAAPSTTLRSLR